MNLGIWPFQSARDEIEFLKTRVWKEEKGKLSVLQTALGTEELWRRRSSVYICGRTRKADWNWLNMRERCFLIVVSVITACVQLKLCRGFGLKGAAAHNRRALKQTLHCMVKRHWRSFVSVSWVQSCCWWRRLVTRALFTWQASTLGGSKHEKNKTKHQTLHLNFVMNCRDIIGWMIGLSPDHPAWKHC